ncbi:MAG: hypothetical protein IKY78_07695 [Clostridia bacterium]|nr:hypothetical protein [Clostridia bacterium]
MKNETLIIIGGDKRQEHLLTILQNDGYNCEILNKSTEKLKDVISEKRYVVLPVPVSKDGKHIYCNNKDFILSFEALGDTLTEKHILFGGGFTKEMVNLMEQKNIVYYDFNNNEDFLIYNAFLTTQGALKLLLDNTEKDITRRNVLITGFGRIGKALSLTLNNLNMNVTVCARKDTQLNMAKYLGFDSIKYDTLKEKIADTDLIFNTVPVQVFDTVCIERIKPDAVFFELASSPFGADKKQLVACGIKYVDGGSLPGRYTPYSAAEKIARITENLI